MRRPGRPLLATLLATVLLAAGLVGCGGGGQDGGRDVASDQAAITQMLKAGLSTNDAATLCRRTLSSGLAARVFGTPAQCEAVQAQATSGRTPATAVQVTQVRVDGDQGTATVRLLGGDEDGTAGQVSVRREAGGWRLSDLSTPFLRSELAAAITSDPAIDRRLRACITRGLGVLDDASLRRMAFGAMSGDPQAQQQLAALVRGCVKAASAPAGGESI